MKKIIIILLTSLVVAFQCDGPIKSNITVMKGKEGIILEIKHFKSFEISDIDLYYRDKTNDILVYSTILYNDSSTKIKRIEIYRYHNNVQIEYQTNTFYSYSIKTNIGYFNGCFVLIDINKPFDTKLKEKCNFKKSKNIIILHSDLN